ncbi:MAG: LysM peptidoglycan-binding domain-containing M23 family metallopeptidase [Anaerolineae bacterium]|nr:LysM peptidoglycan-binding domain-containing M23 family metallopeptidase [Anaerolineae bacterium]
MDDKRSLLERFGGHLVLLVVGLLLLAASRTATVGELLAFERDSEPALQAAVLQAEPVTATPEEDAVLTEGDEVAFDASSVPVLTDNGLVAQPMPITYKPAQPQHEFITYRVESGDTAIRIAEKFGIQEETILGGNSFLSNDAGQLMAGVDIIILPIDGVLHDVTEGETLESISEQYGIPVEDVIAYEPNNLEFPYRLFPGTQILVPGAVREVFVWDPPSYVSSSSSPEAGQGVVVLVPGTGTYIWPTGGRRITQYSWYGHTALDIALTTGSPIYAADTGTVTYASWSPYCYGNLVVINHGNGYETFYAHLNGFNVKPGQTVYQGNTIAFSGNTGCSSGPHLHFEIRYNKARYDPMSYLP